MFDITTATDEELAKLHGDGVIVEAMRRLRESTAKQQAAMKTLTRVIGWLTFVLAVFGAVQVAFIVTEWTS